MTPSLQPHSSFHTQDSNQGSGAITDQILAWYDQHARVLPWRHTNPNPYHVWLSEIMLQQTTVATVKDYYQKFITCWPTVQDLAATDLDDVLAAWAGLGYYARARNLHKCAQVIVREHSGQFPQTYTQLLQLPGIGPYTAGAIAAIAFDQPTAAVDGNIERVFTRLHAITTPLPKAKTEVTEYLQSVMPKQRAGDFIQSLMDLGAAICTPRQPDCPLCPLNNTCTAHQDPALDPTAFPVKPAKKPKPTRAGHVFWLENQAGAVLLRRRPESGLLGGMLEFPSSKWTEVTLKKPDKTQPPTGLAEEISREILQETSPLEGSVRHTFTHFHLELAVHRARVSQDLENKLRETNSGNWHHPDVFDDLALPTLMKKVAREAQETWKTRESGETVEKQANCIEFKG